jgi:hypothetical protein
MDYDDLFPVEEEEALLAQSINEEFNEIEEEYTVIRRKNPKSLPKLLKDIEYDNKVGWVIRHKNNGNKSTKIGKGTVKGTVKDEIINYHKTSYVPGSQIKNAVTGDYYPYLVGSNEEKLLFKVRLSTGEKGTLTHMSGNWIPESNLLFYDSPEEYERQFYGSLSNATKARWLATKTMVANTMQ